MKSIKNKTEAQQRKIHAFRMETRKQYAPMGGVPCGDHAATSTMPFECRKSARGMNVAGQEFLVKHFANRFPVLDA